MRTYWVLSSLDRYEKKVSTLRMTMIDIESLLLSRFPQTWNKPRSATIERLKKYYL